MRPETEAELAGMIRDAGGPLTIRGGGTLDEPLRARAVEPGRTPRHLF